MESLATAGQMKMVGRVDIQYLNSPPHRVLLKKKTIDCGSFQRDLKNDLATCHIFRAIGCITFNNIDENTP